MGEQVQHVHAWADGSPTLGVKVEKNSRGFNYEIKVSGALDAEKIGGILDELHEAVERKIASWETAGG